MKKINKECEIKLLSNANSQIKFASIDDVDTTINKLNSILEIIGIDYGGRINEKIQDKYFDDIENTLEHSKISLRERTIGDKTLLTIKSLVKSGTFGLERKEYEAPCNKSTLTKLKNDRTFFNTFLLENLGIKVDLKSELKLNLTLLNDRITIPIATATDINFKLSYDKFHYYFHTPSPFWSENYYEIEIESEREQINIDPKLESLRKAISQILGFTENTLSKYSQGLKIKNTDESLLVHTFMVDIIDYSRRPARDQKTIIQFLSKTIKEALGDCIIESGLPTSFIKDKVFLLPTGDGMAIVFLEAPSLILKVLVATQKLIGKNGEFQFRAGIHSGFVFKYTDVLNKLNFAGEGINFAQRVMDLGDECQILCTKEAFIAITNESKELKKYFKFIGEYDVKHSIKLEVYNIFDSRTFGNPATPVRYQ